MLRILALVLFLRLSSVTLSSEITSYAKVSRNGQPGRNSHDSFSWISRPLARNNMSMENGNRSINDIVITVSPVYVPPRTPKLKKGEIINHPVIPRYSTLDHEMIAKLDAGKNRIQQRFNPPAVFDNVAHGNGRPQKGTNTYIDTESSPSINSSAFPGPIFPGIYEYSPMGPVLDDEPPMSKPIINKYLATSMDDKIPDSYKSSPNKYHSSDEHETDYPGFDIASSYENDGSGPKPVKFVNPHDHSSPFIDPYEHDHHDFHHDIIYDHVPEFHEHYPKPTTEEPEMNDQRLDKRPYSYYFIGKKLWYIPLYFSIYFIIYIAALVLKSVARHKINFPAHLAEAVTHRKRRESSEGWWYFTERILEGIEQFAETSGQSSEHRVELPLRKSLEKRKYF